VQARDDGGHAADVGDSGGCSSAPVSLRAAVWWPRELATEAGQRKAWSMLLHLGRPHKLLKRRMQPDDKLVIVNISLSFSLSSPLSSRSSQNPTWNYYCPLLIVSALIKHRLNYGVKCTSGP
jgi:hypothetical protein